LDHKTQAPEKTGWSGRTGRGREEVPEPEEGTRAPGSEGAKEKVEVGAEDGVGGVGGVEEKGAEEAGVPPAEVPSAGAAPEEERGAEEEGNPSPTVPSVGAVGPTKVAGVRTQAGNETDQVDLPRRGRRGLRPDGRGAGGEGASSPPSGADERVNLLRG